MFLLDANKPQPIFKIAFNFIIPLNCILYDLLLNLDNCEDLWLEIECKESTFILAVIYRHPNQDLLSFHYNFHNQLKDLENKKINYVVSGDFNLNILAKDNPSVGSRGGHFLIIG